MRRWAGRSCPERVEPRTGEHDLAAGALFALATAASLAVFVPVLFKFVAAVASSGIALALYRVLRHHSAGLTLGSVAFRLVEGTFYALGAVSLLVLVSLRQAAIASGSVDSATPSNQRSCSLPRPTGWAS